jgi:broad specificity phosphatase PhoE
VKTLEVRRHSLTKKGHARDRGSLLSADGVRQARALGEALPAFDRVITGPDRRHVETAIAMGYAVDEMVDWPSGYVPGVVAHHDQWQWPHPFSRYRDLLQESRELRVAVAEHLSHWSRALGGVPDGGRVLVVSSGGSIEPVLVAALPDGDLAGWGGALHHLEGATMTFEGSTCVEVIVRRAAPARRPRP